DTTGCLIDVSDYLNSDNDIIAFSSTGLGGPTSLIMGKSIFNAGGFQPDKSYVVSVKSFENNIEISAIKTYSKTMGSGIQIGLPTAPGSQSNVTLQINSSLIILTGLSKMRGTPVSSTNLRVSQMLTALLLQIQELVKYSRVILVGFIT